MASPSIFRPFFRDPITGIPTAIPDGAILNIGGTTFSTFTVNGVGVMLSDGSTSDNSSTVLWNLQTAYDNTDDGFGFASITMEAGRDFIIYDDDNPSVFFKINATTGKVTISGDLEVNGNTSTINTIVTDQDHLLLSPSSASTVALQIETDSGVTSTANLIDVKDVFQGSTIFAVNALTGTEIDDLKVFNDISLDGLLNGIDIVQLSDTLNTHLIISSNKHAASEINLSPGSLIQFNVPSTVQQTQQAIEYLAETVDLLNTSVTQNSGFTYTEVTGSTTWIINHNQNTQNFIHSLFDASGEQVIPDRFIVVDDNQVRVDFGAPMTGRCNFMFYS